MSAPEALLAYDAMTLRYGSTVAVDALTLEIRRGEMFGLVGPDGAGKTTTLRVGLGLLTPAAGRVTTCGFDPVRRHHDVSRQVGYIAQRFALYGDLTVDENIAFVARIHGVSGWKQRRDELLELVRLTPFRDRLADRLSGGMRQKLALAATLVHRPQLLVLDEPTTGVDPVSRRDFWKLLARLQREGMTILLTTPYLDEAERCQRVAFLHRGKLLAVDDPQSLKEGLPGSIVELLARPRRQAAELLRHEAGVGPVETFGERLHASLPATPHGEAAAVALRLAERLRGAGLSVEDARAVAPSLEDVFISRIRSAEAGGAGARAPEVAP